MRHPAKFRRNQSNRGKNVVIFLFLKIAAAAILDFSNFKFLTVGWHKRAELRHGAKSGQNRSNRSRDMAIFRFVQDGGHPPSWICCACVRTTHEGHLVVFIIVQNLVDICAVVLIICTFFDFGNLACKRLFTPPNWVFWGILPAKWGAMSTKPKKGTSLCESASFEPSFTKIRRHV